MSLTYYICPTRHRRSSQEKFYILDAPTLWYNYPIISVIGSAGAIFQRVHFGPCAVWCSCSDNAIPCKHMIFLFTFLGFKPSPGKFTLDLSRCISTIRKARPFHLNRLDFRANEVCSSFIVNSCVRCNQLNSGDLYACNECDNLFHQHHFPSRLPERCPFCKKLWKPHKSSSTRDGHRNFYSILKYFGYHVTNTRDHSLQPTCIVVPRTP